MLKVYLPSDFPSAIERFDQCCVVCYASFWNGCILRKKLQFYYITLKDVTFMVSEDKIDLILLCIEIS